jgi:putative SOS response-associated peptidase YedK
MCGRYTLKATGAEVAEVFGLDDVPDLTPRYNIAPTQVVPIVRRAPGGAHRELARARFGLLPFWAGKERPRASMINARCETVFSRPAFRTAARERRCLVPADGFFEWRREGRRKAPWYFRLREGRAFAFAGLWERARGPDGEPIESFSILTTVPNDLVREVHDRMPVILAPEQHALWLDPALCDEAALRPLFAPYSAEAMVGYPVGSRVNSPANDDPDCIAERKTLW